MCCPHHPMTVESCHKHTRWLAIVTISVATVPVAQCLYAEGVEQLSDVIARATQA